MKGNFYALRRLFSSVNNFSPQLILVTILFFAFTQVSAKTVVIGNGSGNISQTSMSGLNPGDVLAITPGTYSGASFTNLSGITIINNNGLVTFTGLVRLSADVNVTLSGTGSGVLQFGFGFSGAGGFAITGRCQTMRFYNFQCVGTARFIDVSENQGTLTYAGTQATILFQNVAIANIKMNNSGNLIRGSFGHAYNLNNFVDSVAAWNVTYDLTNGDGSVVNGGNIYRFDFHDMKINEAPASTNKDMGYIFIYGGSGQVHNVYRNGGWGWLVRVFGASIGAPGDVWVYNCIDLNGNCYGTAEVRCDATEWAGTNGWLSGVNIHILNNTSGNKIDGTAGAGYNTAVALIPNIEPGYTGEIRNNISFNDQHPGKYTGNVEYWNMTNQPLQSNNVNYATYTAAGLIDPVNCFLTATSPNIDKGTTVARVSGDIDGIARPQGAAYDLGAREFNQNTPPPVNQPPVANAGANQIITLPINSVSLTGASSSDPDGTIASYSWAQVAGPSTATITNGNTATPTAGALLAGAYTFELTVTDNKGATAKAQVKITVNAMAVNLPPVANAGADQTITLPINSASLTGASSSDSDGTIASYSWAQVAGPSTSTITNGTTATPTVGLLLAGAYTFELTVTDNKGATAKAQVKITVSAAAVNLPPVSDPGSNQTITLPTNSVTLDGTSSSDPDGTVASYAWSQISGPGGSTITNSTAGSTVVSGLTIVGTYVYSLTVKDNGGLTATANITITVNAPPNGAPTANAGADQNITLPTSSITADASGSIDPDGTIAAYSWTESSGPSTATIANAANVNTNITGLIQGTYIFKLTVTDNSGAKDTDSITVKVNAAVNQAPTANGGADQNITLPTSSISVDASGSIDPDGTIAAYSWTQSSGPSTATIANAANVNTNITGLIQGTYIFKLTVTDNGGAKDTDSITVKVNAAANQAPTANGGADQNITLPTSSVAVDASGSIDPDGTIAAYSWTQSSGPSTATIANAANVNTNITGLIQGTYIFKLTVTDNNGAKGTDSIIVKVNAAANQAPVANAGPSASITLPASSVNLDGTASSDPDGTIASYNWAQITGPSTSTITNGNTATPTAAALVAGVYTFELTVTDNKGATAKAQVKITVITSGSLPPVANAGADQTITLPVSQVTLNGGASQAPAGSITAYAWTQSSGPSTATIVSPSNVSTVVNSLVQGTYVFKIEITDNTGAKASDIVTVTVNKAPNKAPTANAGSSKTITHPVKSTKLDATLSSDPDGSIVSYSWAEVAGPTTATVTGGNTATPTTDNLDVGQYTFELTVTDNDGATANAQVKITVLAAANQPPVANAGASRTISLPVNSVTLSGSASTDPDGSIASFSWAQISGPSTAVVTSANTATPTLGSLQAGQYIFELTVTDNQGATAKAQVKITVLAAANQPPVANAGASRTISLPVNSVTLSGSASSDPDGSIVSFSWAQISGPSTAAVTSANTATPTLGSLQAGQYIFELTVTDNQGATAKAQVKITVLAVPNQAPVANAGTDKTITLPTSSVSLSGTLSSDPDGTIVSYGWTTVSGPGAVTISNSNTATPSASGLLAGVYVFELTVTDNRGGTAKDQVKVTVNAATAPPATNQLPVANAGSDQTITLPISSVTLNGTNSYDPDGSIASYAWVQVSGPSTASIAGTNSGAPVLSNLKLGTYIFELTVTDNKAATAKDRVTINVNDQVNKPNDPPVANAGKDTTIVLPANSVVLDGTASVDPNGTISTFQWQETSGPNTAAISSLNNAVLTVSDLVTGEYTFQLTVTDNNGATSTATVKVKVMDNLRSNESILLYPNPVHDVLNVRLTSDSNGTVKVNIYDMNGRLVHASQMEKQQNYIDQPINVNRLAGGMYTLQAVIGSNKIMLSKFIKQ